ncbi:MAG: hypothetical protein E6Q50_09610 [Lysobacter sp.]|nr:MAG: hypothetical protein E6Q50_09610 [Lysobacter sp.]
MPTTIAAFATASPPSQSKSRANFRAAKPRACRRDESESEIRIAMLAATRKRLIRFGKKNVFAMRERCRARIALAYRR